MLYNARLGPPRRRGRCSTAPVPRCTRDDRDDGAAMRARYDADSSGEAAPHTDFVSIAEVRDLFSPFRTVEVDRRNLSAGRVPIPRDVLLRTRLDRLMGLDLYIRADTMRAAPPPGRRRAPALPPLPGRERADDHGARRVLRPALAAPRVRRQHRPRVPPGAARASLPGDHPPLLPLRRVDLPLRPPLPRLPAGVRRATRSPSSRTSTGSARSGSRSSTSTGSTPSTRCSSPSTTTRSTGSTRTSPRCVRNLTGYVSDDLVEQAKRLTIPDEQRTIDVGYRARQLAFWMGRGVAGEARDRRAVPRARGGSRAEARHRYRGAGPDLRRRLVRVRRQLPRHARRRGRHVDLRPRRHRAERTEALLAAEPDLDFEEVSQRVLHEYEGKIHYRTISPRHFEAAALRVAPDPLPRAATRACSSPTCHYFPLEKDFSNFDDVMARFTDPDERRRITDRGTTTSSRRVATRTRRSSPASTTTWPRSASPARCWSVSGGRMDRALHA